MPGAVSLNNVIVLDGRVVGTWKRALKKGSVAITPNLFAPLNETETHAFAAEASRYGTFLGLPVSISW